VEEDRLADQGRASSSRIAETGGGSDASIQTTVDTYGHLLPDPDEHETVDRLDALGTNGHKMGTLHGKRRRIGRVIPRRAGAPGTTRTCDTRFRKTKRAQEVTPTYISVAARSCIGLH
jgi:hypothetical protein